MTTSAGDARVRQDAAPPAPPTVVPPEPPAPPARKNLIVVVIDTLRRDHLGLYGYGRPTSPALDAFAKEAVVFDRCMSTSSWTEPATVSLLSGLYPPRHGCHEYDVLSPDVEMLAETLHDAGYRTGGVSGNPNASPILGFGQGLDSFYFAGNEVAREYVDAHKLLNEARKFLAADDGRPFFLWIQLMNVHGPYRAPPEYRNRFIDGSIIEFKFQNKLWTDILRHGRLERRADVRPEHLRDLAARYDGAIAYTDELLGKFLRGRLAAGGAANDVMVVVADHGEELFDHGGFGHGVTLHQELLDVPLLIRRAGGEGGGARISAPVSLVDLPATLLDLLGLLPAERGGRFGDGTTLVPLFHGGTIERDAPLVAQVNRAKQGRIFLLQQWPLRLVETDLDYAGRAGVVELFDLEQDPHEQHDLASADPERTEKLRAALRRQRKALEAAAFSASKHVLSDAERKKLDALGYGGEAEQDR